MQKQSEEVLWYNFNMAEETKEVITHVTVFWNEDSTSEYDDIVALDIDKEMGYPRMVIRDSNNIVEVINLDFVQAYQAKLETVQ